MILYTIFHDTRRLIIPINLGIIGYGFVGQAVANGFKIASGGKDTIKWYDKFKDGSSVIIFRQRFPKTKIFLTDPTTAEVGI